MERVIKLGIAAAIVSLISVYAMAKKVITEQGSTYETAERKAIVRLAYSYLFGNFTMMP